MIDICTEQRFLIDVAQHEMTIICDNGVNRHVHFKREGTRCYQFDLITWPGYLCYTGDMGTYVFTRLSDMFDFFRTGINDFMLNKDGLSINPGYWGEKLEAVDKHDGFKKFSLDLFRENVREHLKGESHSKQLWEEIESSLLDVYFGNGHEAYQAVYEFNYEGFQFSDFEYTSEEYSFRFIWCCYALAWGIQKYDEKKAEPCVHVVCEADVCAKCGEAA